MTKIKNALNVSNVTIVASAEKQAIFDFQCFSSILEMAKKSKISAISGVAMVEGNGHRATRPNMPFGTGGQAKSNAFKA